MKYNFIIPYRNRKEHLNEFINRFSEYFKNKDIDAEFYIIHQINSGEFNRGACLNIGFLEVSKIRPDGLFIFHDVDIFPAYWGAIVYDALPAQVRHPVGLQNHNLGTICCFWKDEFEKVNGFPNYWGWGIEDVTILHRVKKENIQIDETNIVDLNDTTRIIMPKHKRDIQKEELTANKNTKLYNIEITSGKNTNGLSNLKYEVLSSFELAPNFKVINIDFRILDES